MIKLFKQYCWNNLLHNQVRTCLVYALSAASRAAGDVPTISALQTHVSTTRNGPMRPRLTVLTLLFRYRPGNRL